MSFKYKKNNNGNIMRIKNKKNLHVFMLVCLMGCAENTPLNTQVTLIPEQLYSSLPSDVVPELATNGKFKVGVKTLEIVNPAQFDVATQTTKDRKLAVEVWYPSNADNTSIKTSYENETRTGIEFSMQADAYRDAAVLLSTNDAKYPLVVISHGYTGYNTIMFYLAEHLASHGYIVAAIDHTDSTNADVDVKVNPASGFFSTLLNRSRDQQFTLNYLTTQSHFASAAVDNTKAGLIGYSMGGFGAINTIGGCYNFTQTTTSAFTGITEPEQLKKIIALLNSCAGGQYQNVKVDSKWQAVVAMAPWGGQHQLFNEEALAAIDTPMLYIAGDLDDISGYEGIKSLYEKTGTNNKYLLTYQNARHNIAKHPAPLLAKTNELDLGHYYEGAWDSAVLNNTNKHFTLAMMDCYLKQQIEKCSYLDLSADSNQKAIDGKTPKPWKGFDHRFSVGMAWQKAK